jgi:hypothetical protein
VPAEYDAGVRTILVLTERDLREHDVLRIADLYGPDPFQVRLLIPVGDDRGALTEAVEDLALGKVGEVLHTSPGFSADQAAEAMAAATAALRAAGITATGEVTPADPVATVAAAATVEQAEQVLVLTEPHPVEDTLHRDWASRLRSVLTIPVLHVLAGTDRIIT